MERYIRHQPEGEQVVARDLVRVQDILMPVLEEFTERLVNDNFLIEDVELETATELLVEHKLGRQLVGWWVVDKNAAATIHRSSDADEYHLPLTSDANVTVSLVVF